VIACLFDLNISAYMFKYLKRTWILAALNLNRKERNESKKGEAVSFNCISKTGCSIYRFLRVIGPMSRTWLT